MSEKLSEVDAYCQKRTEEARRDPRSTHELISASLSEADDERAWEHVVTLHFRATRDVLEAAGALSRSECAEERSLAANILGQLGVPERAFPEECHQLLAGLLEVETDSGVLADVCVACGHLGHPGAVPLLVPLRHHADASVRYAVVHGLMGQEDPQAVAALIELSSDADADVRDWATFALGTQLDLDTPEIREALAHRLNDPDAATRAEAVVGLAKRRDERVLPVLAQALEEGEERCHLDVLFSFVLEAAEVMANPRLLSALFRCREQGCKETAALDRALRACGGSSV
jgi:HEAT repeat protein